MGNLAPSVTFRGILSARRIVAQFLQPTPLIHYPELSERLGFHAYIKHENHLPTGCFKVRGGLNFMHHFREKNSALGKRASRNREARCCYGDARKSRTIYCVCGGAIRAHSHGCRAAREQPGEKQRDARLRRRTH